MGQDFDMGNVEAGGVLEGLGQGLGNAMKNMYTIQQSRKMMDMKQEQLDNESDYKHAQVDYLEGRGDLMSSQADAARFNINRAKKISQGAIDAGHEHIDTAQQQTTQQVGQYRTLLNKVIQTPQGQDYLASKMGGASEADGNADQSDTVSPQAQGADQPQSDQGSNVVNNIMPGVGAQNQPDQGLPAKGPLANGYAPVSNAQNMKAISDTGASGSAKPAKRDVSLQKAMGKINSMGIDSREDAEYAMDKYYGADWRTNKDAVGYLNQKFGGQGGAQGAPGGAADANLNGNANAGDMVKVTAPDGTPYTMPRANLQKAIKRGYRVRQ